MSLRVFKQKLWQTHLNSQYKNALRINSDEKLENINSHVLYTKYMSIITLGYQNRLPPGGLSNDARKKMRHLLEAI
jgi:hypothetical protein